MQQRELTAEELRAKDLAKDEFERRSQVLMDAVKKRGMPTTEQEKFEFLCDMRQAYGDCFEFLNTTAKDVIPEAVRNELLAEGHKRLAQLERDYATSPQASTKLPYWSYPHLWPALALIGGLILMAVKFGGAS